MDVKAASLKEPGNYRRGGHWWPREESHFQPVWHHEGEGRYVNGGGEADGEEMECAFV